MDQDTGVPSQASLSQGPCSLHSVGYLEQCGTDASPSSRRRSESRYQNPYQLIASVPGVLANYAAPIGLRDRLSECLLEWKRQAHFLGTSQQARSGLTLCCQCRGIGLQAYRLLSRRLKLHESCVSVSRSLRQFFRRGKWR